MRDVNDSHLFFVQTGVNDMGVKPTHKCKEWSDDAEASCASEKVPPVGGMSVTERFPVAPPLGSEYW